MVFFRKRAEPRGTDQFGFCDRFHENGLAHWNTRRCFFQASGNNASRDSRTNTIALRIEVGESKSREGRFQKKIFFSAWLSASCQKDGAISRKRPNPHSSPVSNFRKKNVRDFRGILKRRYEREMQMQSDELKKLASAFRGDRLSVVGALLVFRADSRRESSAPRLVSAPRAPPPSYSMGMTSCDAALTSTPGSRTMMARKMSSSATCCRSGETSVTSSCGENSGVRWQMST